MVDDVMSLDEYVNRFRDLKRRSFEVSNKIKKLAEREANEESAMKKPKTYQMEVAEGDAQPVQDNAKNHKLKLMGYTMREYENWEKKTQDKKAKRDGANLQELAKYSYEKQLSKIKKHGEVPQKTRISKDRKTGKIKVNDDSRLVNRLSNDLKKTSEERYMARKKEMEKRNLQPTAGGYVNDKNKQFNEKLDRQSRDLKR